MSDKYEKALEAINQIIAEDSRTSEFLIREIEPIVLEALDIILTDSERTERSQNRCSHGSITPETRTRICAVCDMDLGPWRRE